MAPTDPWSRLRGTLGNRSHALGCREAAGSQNGIIPQPGSSHPPRLARALHRRGEAGRSPTAVPLQRLFCLESTSWAEATDSQGGRRRLGAPKHTPRQTPSPRNPGARNRFGVAGQTYSSGDWPPHTTGWGSCLGHPQGADEGRSMFQEAVAIAGEKRAPGRETIASPLVAPWPAPQAADLGLRICSYGPGAPAGPSVCRRAPSQGRVSLRRPRRGGRRAARRGREPGCGVSAGGRLASALGLCSASVAPPTLRLREQTAPGHATLNCCRCLEAVCVQTSAGWLGILPEDTTWQRTDNRFYCIYHLEVAASTMKQTVKLASLCRELG
ncbi:uncharacterized protein LOC143440429 [Arvicanthis niloticus]|uniref:uncharacterized protein LOC117700400 n=1 Tax=Arvicanthis niloticus TaxID=61156 RepID=UPI00402BF49A